MEPESDCLKVFYFYCLSTNLLRFQQSTYKKRLFSLTCHKLPFIRALAFLAQWSSPLHDQTSHKGTGSHPASTGKRGKAEKRTILIELNFCRSPCPRRFSRRSRSRPERSRRVFLSTKTSKVDQTTRQLRRRLRRAIGKTPIKLVIRSVGVPCFVVVSSLSKRFLSS